MYGRFTEKAEKAINLSQEGAMLLGHSYVGSEHLLLGLVKEGTGVAARVLQGQGITEEKILKEIDELIGRGDNSSSQPRLACVPDTCDNTRACLAGLRTNCRKWRSC